MKFPRYLYLFVLLSTCLSAGVSHADTIQRRVAAGVNHSLTLKEDGTLWTWGDNNYGQLGIGSTVDQWFPAQMSSLSNVATAAGGLYHSAAAKVDGTVWAWGYNAYGQLGDGTTTQRTMPVQVSGLTSVVAVAAGDHHSVALKSDGTVWAWGYNYYGQLGDGTTTNRTTPVQVNGLSGVAAIAAGQYFTLALKSDGTIWAWGYNGYGQLGDGTATNRSVPVRSGTLYNVVAIAAGQRHGVALKADGTVWDWGYNGYGQLGDGTTTQRLAAVQASAVANIVAVGAGQYHTVAVKNDGTAVAWGYNTYGQLGDGTTTQRNTAVSLSGIGNAAAAAAVAAGNHTLILKSDGSIWSTGLNTNGQLGKGTVANASAPAAVVSFTFAGQVAMPTFSPEGGHYLQGQSVTVSCATAGATIRYTTNGTDPTASDPVVSSGSSINVASTTFLRAKAFLTGYSPSITKSGLYQIGGYVVTGLNHSLAIKPDGTLWSWGYNNYGQLGNGGTGQQWYPAQVSGLSNVVVVAAGANHSLAAEGDGTVWAWGYNYYGQLGDGSTTQRNAPVQASGLTNVMAVAVGDLHSVALKSDGTVWAWGNNGNGRLGDGTTTNRTTPVQVSGLSGVIAIAAGSNFTLALKNDGTVWSWGYNYYGSLGNGSSADSYVPVRSGTIYDVVAIDTGYLHAVALKADGTVWDWGYDNYGQLGNGTTNTSYVAVLAIGVTNAIGVAAGQYHTLAVKSDGTVMAWGYNNYGQLGDGTNTNRSTPVVVSNLSGVISVSAGSHSVAVKNDGTIWSFGTNTYGQLGNGTGANSNVPTVVVNLTLGTQASTPTFTPEGGDYLQSQSVTVSCATPGATIRYTTNGADPTASDPVVSSGSSISVASSTFLRAKAFKSGYSPSNTKSGVYHIGGYAVTGLNQTLVIKPDGTLWSWGSNNYGQLGLGSTGDQWYPALVSSLSNVAAAAGGTYHSVAAKTDGTVWAWGRNAYGEVGDGTTAQRSTPVQVSGLTNVVAVTAGENHSVALKSDGTVWAWGNNNQGQLGDGTITQRIMPVQVSGLSGVIAITAGEYATLALKSDGTVWSWGYNYYGQLGNGTSSNSSIPVRSGTIYDVVAIEAGQSHAVALKADGTVWDWGLNNYGQLGNGLTNNSYVAVRAIGVTNAIAVAAGQYHTIAMKSDGTVMAWGYNDNGQLGDGTNTNRSAPVAVANLTGVTFIGAGTHSVAMKNDGTIWSFGTNTYGQLGNGTNGNSNVPTAVVNFIFGDQVAMPTFSPEGGFYSQLQTVTVSCATSGAVIHYTTNGTEPTEADPAVASGSSVSVVNTTILRAKAFKTGSATSQVKSGAYQIGLQLTSGENHSLAVNSDGTVWTWGDNYYGQLGIGTTNDQSAPVQVSSLNNVVEVAGGGSHSIAVKSDGTVSTWGYNYYGQLGDGTITQRNSPVTVTNISGVTTVAAGTNHTVAMKADGTVWAWGLNSNGQLGDGTTTQRNTPVQVIGLNGVTGIAAAGNFTMALKGDGTVWAWGYNAQGQLGDGTTTQRTTPVQVSGLSGVTAITAGQYHAVALKSDGTSWAWGYNGSGQLGDGGTASRSIAARVGSIFDVMSIACGQSHTLIVKGDGTVWGCGANGYGQLGDGTTTQRLIPVLVNGLAGATSVSGWKHSLATAPYNGSLLLWGWGSNINGQVGDGTSFNRSVPVLITAFPYPDSDGDGLPDWREVLLGTNPSSPDTDGDGMPDGWEVNHGLNPLVNDASLDPDGDGFTNLQEYQNGTHPYDFCNVPTTGLKLWLRADSGITKDANNFVSRWADQSGNGNDSIQNTPSYRPQWLDDSLNGKPILRFDGVDDQLVAASSAGSNNFTIFAVTKTANTHQIDVESASGTSGTAGQHYLFGALNLGVAGVCGAGVSMGTNGISVYEHAPNYMPALAVYQGQVGSDFNVVTVKYTSNQPQIFLNGSLVRTGLHSPLATVNAPTQIGSGYYGAFGGDVAEILIYNSALTDSDRSLVEHCLNDKYALIPSLPAPPTNLQANAISSSQIGLAWMSGSANAVDLKLERKTGALGIFTEIATINPRLTTYIDRDLTPGLQYFYRVRVTNLAGVSDPSNVADATTLNDVPPVVFDGLTVWLRSDAGVLKDGSNRVTSWIDQSNSGANGNDAKQASADLQPVWMDDATYNKPAIRFDGVNDQLVTTNGPSTNNFTIFVVAQTSQSHEIDVESASSTAGTSGQHYLFGAFYRGVDTGAGISMGTNGISVYEHGTNVMAPLAVDNESVNDYSVVTVRYASKQPQIYLNGVLRRVGLTSPRTNVYAPIEIGSGAYGAFNGMVAEVLIYDTALSENARRGVENYLVRKYGLIDSDRDGLTDREELQYDTDPYNPDTNGDGILDGTAIRLGISATSLDTDGDGLTNAQEYAMGTNPLVADTDRDGVPDGQDAFPLDPTRWETPANDPNDHTPPQITLIEPADAVLLP